MDYNLDGRSVFDLTSVQVNVPVDAARFAKRAPPAPPPPTKPGCPSGDLLVAQGGTPDTAALLSPRR